jgi:hypothetical protein
MVGQMPCRKRTYDRPAKINYLYSVKRLLSCHPSHLSIVFEKKILGFEKNGARKKTAKTKAA